MAINFPASPADGDVYLGYYWDDAKGAWRSQQANSSSVITSPTTPTGATAGDLWFNSNDGTLYVYYNDGISTYWTEIKANSALTTTLDDRLSLIEAGNRRIPGSIAQVQQVVKTDFFVAAVNANAFVDVTGLTLTVAPKYENSKFLISVVVQGSAAVDGVIRLLRNGTLIGAGTAGSSTQSGISFMGLRSMQYEGYSNAGNFLDFPATLSPLTYKVQVGNASGSNIYVNRPPSGAAEESMISTITVMEVAQ